MKYILSLIFLLLCSCASHRHVSSNINSWGDSCYKGFSAHVTQIVGEDAESCGFVKEGSTVFEVESVSKCDKLKAEKGIPFVFGYSGREENALTCNVIAKDVKTKIWFVYHNNGAGVNMPMMHINECNKLEFSTKPNRINEVATVNGCEFNSDLFNKVFDPM